MLWQVAEVPGHVFAFGLHKHTIPFYASIGLICGPNWAWLTEILPPVKSTWWRAKSVCPHWGWTGRQFVPARPNFRATNVGKQITFCGPLAYSGAYRSLGVRTTGLECFCDKCWLKLDYFYLWGIHHLVQAMSTVRRINLFLILNLFLSKYCRLPLRVQLFTQLAYTLAGLSLVGLILCS